MNSSQLNLFLQFLKKNAREDLKVAALHELLGLTGSEDESFLHEHQDIARLLVECLTDKNEIICKTACQALVNISATENGANYLMNTFQAPSDQVIITQLLKHVLDPDSDAADAACMTLSNLTRQSHIAKMVTDYLIKDCIEIEKLIRAFINLSYNSKGCCLHYLGSLFCNLTQNIDFRRELMNKNRSLLKKLLPFTQFEQSLVRRSGIVGALKNCCFETEYHQWLLGVDVDILPYMLLPLAGPEEFSEEDNEKLPVDLQYLGDEKKRELESDVRKMLLEAILQLCATKFGREYLRSKNVYVILREYHKWERDRSILLTCENIVDIIIRTEEEINEDNIKELEVPEKYIEKFEKMDTFYLQDD